MREGEKKRGNEGVAEERKERKGNKSGMEEYRTEETGGITVGGGENELRNYDTQKEKNECE